MARRLVRRRAAGGAGRRRLRNGPCSSTSGGATSTTRFSRSWWRKPSASTPAYAPRACASSRRAHSSASPAAASTRNCSSSTPTGCRVGTEQSTAAICDFWTGGVGLDVGWELDFWGKFRRGIEAADAGYFASIAQYDDSRCSSRRRPRASTPTIRTIELRLRIAHENAALQKRSLEITERLFRSGNESELDVQQARTLYLSTLATIPELEGSLRQTQNALAILLARPPGPLPELEAGRERIPEADLGIIAEVPADLLRRRPDVRTAELQMAAQSARIGVSKSELYPAIALDRLARPLGDLGDAARRTTLDWGLGPALVWNIFDYGRLKNQVLRAGRPLPAALRAVPGHRAARGQGAGRRGDRLRAASRTGRDPRGIGAGGAPLPRHRRRAVPRGPRRLPEGPRLAARALQPAGAPREHEGRRRAEPDRPLQGDGRWLAGGPRAAHRRRRDPGHDGRAQQLEASARCSAPAGSEDSQPPPPTDTP